LDTDIGSIPIGEIVQRSKLWIRNFFLHENLVIEEVVPLNWIVCKKNDNGWNAVANINILKFMNLDFHLILILVIFLIQQKN
jgi:hypothetical protein